MALPLGAGADEAGDVDGGDDASSWITLTSDTSAVVLIRRSHDRWLISAAEATANASVRTMQLAFNATGVMLEGNYSYTLAGIHARPSASSVAVAEHTSATTITFGLPGAEAAQLADLIYAGAPVTVSIPFAPPPPRSPPTAPSPPQPPVGCYTGDGQEYEGSASTTQSGLTCQQWALDVPHTHNYHFLPHNWCRNPDLEDKPWCYTSSVGKRREVCAVPRCASPPPVPPLSPPDPPQQPPSWPPPSSPSPHQPPHVPVGAPARPPPPPAQPPPTPPPPPDDLLPWTPLLRRRLEEWVGCGQSEAGMDQEAREDLALSRELKGNGASTSVSHLVDDLMAGSTTPFTFDGDDFGSLLDRLPALVLGGACEPNAAKRESYQTFALRFVRFLSARGVNGSHFEPRVKEHHWVERGGLSPRDAFLRLGGALATTCLLLNTQLKAAGLASVAGNAPGPCAALRQQTRHLGHGYHLLNVERRMSEPGLNSDVSRYLLYDRLVYCVLLEPDGDEDGTQVEHLRTWRVWAQKSLTGS